MIKDQVVLYPSKAPSIFNSKAKLIISSGNSRACEYSSPQPCDGDEEDPCAIMQNKLHEVIVEYISATAEIWPAATLG